MTSLYSLWGSSPEKQEIPGLLEDHISCVDQVCISECVNESPSDQVHAPYIQAIKLQKGRDEAANEFKVIEFSELLLEFPWSEIRGREGKWLNVMFADTEGRFLQFKNLHL